MTFFISSFSVQPLMFRNFYWHELLPFMMEDFQWVLCEFCYRHKLLGHTTCLLDTKLCDNGFKRANVKKKSKLFCCKKSGRKKNYWVPYSQSHTEFHRQTQITVLLLFFSFSHDKNFYTKTCDNGTCGCFYS